MKTDIKIFSYRIEYHFGECELHVSSSNSKFWYLNGQRHRDDGPAIIYFSGRKEWYQHGLRHREDGPAVEGPGQLKEWWINGKEVKSPNRT
jgi:hypothetical protein